jgi:hypothetical protein
MCGSTDLTKQDGVFVCQTCGTKYSVEEAKKMMIDGTVDVTGSTVKVDTSDELANLYQIARRAKDDNNSENAAKYYEMILIKDPTSWEASFYVVYFKAMECKIAQIRSAGLSVAFCVESVLKLIKDNVQGREEQVKAVQEVATRCETISRMLYYAAMNHYKGVDERIRYDYQLDLMYNCEAAIRIMCTLGNHVDVIFGDYEELHSVAVGAWKNVIECRKYLMPYLYNTRKEANKNTIMACVEKVQKYDSSYPTPTIELETKQPSNGGCYVATAVYGSYDCPQVWTLRRYRDYTLAETWYGRAFIRTYYAISPTLVRWFGHTDWFKKMWKGKLDRMVADLNAKGVENTPYQDRNW